MIVAALRRVPVASAHSSRGRDRATNHRFIRSSVVPPIMNIFGGLFGGNGSKREGKNNDVLQWARTAKKGTEVAPAAAPEGLEIATFARGCFWSSELIYQRVPCVKHTSVGYTQGHVPSPTYDEVCSGSTGHTEAVQVYFDPAEGSYPELLDVFFKHTDPTTLNRQGNDSGTQYRSGIYYHTPEQKAAAEAAVAQAQAQLDAGTFGRRCAGSKVVVEVAPAVEYYLAESYHQQYLSKGGRSGSAQCADKGCTDPIRCYG